MQVKFFINPRLHARFEDAEYKSLPNAQIEIKGCVPVSDLMVNIKIVSSIKEIDSDNNFSYYSFDSLLKEYPQKVANCLSELIADLHNRGESESAWFDFEFEMKVKLPEGTMHQDASFFDFVEYYNDLQAQKSKALLASGFDSIMSVKMKLEEDKQVHGSFLPILGEIFNPNT